MRNFIGEGALWKVYLLDSEIKIDGITFQQYIEKRPKNDILSIADNITKYLAVKDAKLPTLAFFEESKDKQYIVAEYLNTNSTTYVSPNTVRHRPTLLSLLAPKNVQKNILRPSISEKHFLENKLKTIINFEEIIAELTETAQKASKAKLGLCEDAFFFGITQKENDCFLTHKIADFDCIINCEDSSYAELEYDNIHTALCSLFEFVNCFIEDGPLVNGYQEKIKKQLLLVKETKVKTILQ